MSQRREARQQKRETRREARAARQGAARARRSRFRLPILAIAAAGVVLGVGWLIVRPGSSAAPGAGGLPGPLGGPNVSQDVNTLVGKPAPTFTLADSEGNIHTVSPGQGRALVLVTHMGIT